MNEIAQAMVHAENIKYGNTLAGIPSEEFMRCMNELISENVYFDMRDFIKAIIESRYSPSRRYFAPIHANLVERFLKIQAEFLCDHSDICQKCQTPKHLKQGHGVFGSDQPKRGVSIADDFYRNPPPEFFGGMYSGIVVVMGRPAIPYTDKEGFRDAEKEYWNKSVMEKTGRFCREPNNKNFNDMNRVTGQFIPRFRIAEEGVFLFQKWEIDINKIAFLNIYKCRTLNNYKPHLDQNLKNCLYCAKHYFLKQIRDLEPRLIIYLSKKIREISTEILKEVKYDGRQCHILEEESEKIVPDSRHREIRVEIEKALSCTGSRRRSTHEKMAIYLRESREGFLCAGTDYTELFKEFEKKGERTIRNVLAGYYSEKLLDGLEGMIDRLIKVKPVYTDIRLNNAVEAILRESGVAYIHGLYSASIILSRSALESVLKIRYPNFHPETEPLKSYLIHALNKGAVSGDEWKYLDDFRKEANKVVHKNYIIDQEHCLRYLNDIRLLANKLLLLSKTR